jgi:hypothetical protein
MREVTMSALVIATLGLGLASEASAAKSFSLKDIRGAYSFSFQGEIVGVGPVAAIGRLEADGKGNITRASRTISINGASLFQTFTCTLFVDPDGTGSATCPLDDPPIVETFDFVLEDKGRTFRFVGTTPGIVVLGSGERQ